MNENQGIAIEFGLRSGVFPLLAGVLVICFLIAGCTMVGPDFVKPEAPVAEEWTEMDIFGLMAQLGAFPPPG